MDGVLIVNKEKGVTSRDVVNKICKILNTKKVGHTGTLDPIATGVLVVCVGKATKLVEILTSEDKEYIATVKLGVLTDTLDTDGKVLEEKDVFIKKEDLVRTLNSFVGFYDQEVPIYSAVKINGKKLYEYARSNIKVDLPKRRVEIKKIELLEFNKDHYKFKVLVSKGTYIRSLIKDINDKLKIIGSMSDLIRTKQGDFDIKDSYTISEINDSKYNLLTVTDVLKDENCVIIDDTLFKVVKNGGLIDNVYNKSFVTFIYNEKVVSIYKSYEKDNSKMKPYKMFI
ncbi:MAG: tRNA pseudouridine(55) synthase TruB [Tenericutes bacterium]|nr:tRNA pseudouridine(55) synthase TruB [Mycoplasmatota bacterium]